MGPLVPVVFWDIVVVIVRAIVKEYVQNRRIVVDKLIT